MFDTYAVAMSVSLGKYLPKNNSVLHALAARIRSSANGQVQALPLGELGLDITRKCNAKCRHCYHRVRDETPETSMSTTLINMAVAVAAEYDTRQVAVWGGEPTEKMELLGDVFSAAREHNYENIELITNASPFGTQEKAAEFLKETQRSAPDSIIQVSLSCDKIHQERIPLEKCANLVAAYLRSNLKNMLPIRLLAIQLIDDPTIRELFLLLEREYGVLWNGFRYVRHRHLANVELSKKDDFLKAVQTSALIHAITRDHRIVYVDALGVCPTGKDLDDQKYRATLTEPPALTEAQIKEISYPFWFGNIDPSISPEGEVYPLKHFELLGIASFGRVLTAQEFRQTLREMQIDPFLFALCKMPFSKTYEYIKEVYPRAAAVVQRSKSIMEILYRLSMIPANHDAEDYFAEESA